LTGLPACDVSRDDVTHLRVDDVITLSCSSNYSGNSLPLLDWHRVDTPVPSADRYDVRLARRDIRVLTPFVLLPWLPL